MGGGKTARAVTGLQSESASGMLRVTFGDDLNSLPRRLSDVLLMERHGRRLCRGAAEAIPATAENPSGYGMPVKQRGR